MSDQNPNNQTDFIQKLEAVWAELFSYIDALTENQMTEVFDNQGWNVRDHITHLAAWEESVVMLFQGKPRHQTLGVELEKFTSENIDNINAALRERWKSLSVVKAIEEFKNIHHRLLLSLKGLSDTDFAQPVMVFFPQTPPGEGRYVYDMLQANTTDHYLEHLPWIKKIVSLKE